MVGAVRAASRIVPAILLASWIIMRPVMPSLASDPWSMLIKSVEIDESLWGWKGNLADSLNLQVGKPYNPADATRSLNLIRATGDFETVDLITVFHHDGVTLRFDLRPYDIVSDVNIKGNYFLLKKVIRSVIRTSAQEVFDHQRAEKDILRINKLYERHGFFGTKVTMRITPEKRRRGIEVVFEIDEGEPGVIQKISFEGNVGFSIEQLSSEQKISPLSYYSPEKLEEDAERLTDFYRQNGFIAARVEVETNLSRGLSLPSLSIAHPLKSLSALLPGEYVGVDVVFRVYEGEKYDIRIKGNEKVNVKTIRKMITFYKSGFFDQYEADESREAILSHYRANGHYHVKVSFDLDKEGRTVLFQVEEGPVVTIKRINYIGNTLLDSKALRRLMISSSRSFRKIIYRADVIAEDLKKTEAYYLSRGFTRVDVSVSEITFNQERDRMTILISIEEGPRTVIRKVTFLGAALFNHERLIEIAGIPPQSFFDPDWVNTAKKKVLDYYSRLGYADCRINADLNFSPDGEWVEVAFNIREGVQRLLGNMIVRGNGRTHPYVVTREMDLHQGDAYDPIRIFQGRRQLFDLSLFDRVDLVNPKQQESGESDLIVSVRERKTGKFSLGVGYESEERYRGFIEIGENNLWGTARGLRLRWKLSTLGQRYDIIYKEPWVLGFHQDVSLNLYDEFKKEIGYDIRRMGGKIFSDRMLVRYTNLYLAYRYESVDYADIRPSLLEEEELPEEFRISSVQGRLTYDRRDNTVNPHRGYYASGSAESATPLLGSEAQFNKYQLQAVYVQPLSSTSELVLSTRVGLANKVLSGDELPLSERFFAGGAGTVRGYSERSLGPLDVQGTPLGGEAMLLANIEWRFKLYKSLGGVIFMDTGNVWKTPGDFDISDMKQSVGIGLRYETPVGPARLEYGRKLEVEPHESNYRIHFTLGHPF